MKQVQESCNCYEGIDQMINEGGHADSFIYFEKILEELELSNIENTVGIINKGDYSNGIS